MVAFAGPSPKELAAQIGDLVEFRQAYIPYLNSTVTALRQGQHVEHGIERNRVIELAVKAGLAVGASGVTVGVLPPAYAPGKPPIFGLAGVAFAHEDPVYRVPNDLLYDAPKQSFEYALDAVASAGTLLTLRLEKETARRRRPTYWADRALRRILGFPAYLLSLIFAFDLNELSNGKARLVWYLSIVADAAGVYAFGVGQGWWGGLSG